MNLIGLLSLTPVFKCIMATQSMTGKNEFDYLKEFEDLDISGHFYANTCILANILIEYFEKNQYSY